MAALTPAGTASDKSQNLLVHEPTRFWKTCGSPERLTAGDKALIWSRQNGFRQRIHRRRLFGRLEHFRFIDRIHGEKHEVIEAMPPVIVVPVQFQIDVYCLR